jgi:hypothetical protein
MHSAAFGLQNYPPATDYIGTSLFLFFFYSRPHPCHSHPSRNDLPTEALHRDLVGEREPYVMTSLAGRSSSAGPRGRARATLPQPCRRAGAVPPSTGDLHRGLIGAWEPSATSWRVRGRCSAIAWQARGSAGREHSGITPLGRVRAASSALLRWVVCV